MKYEARAGKWFVYNSDGECICEITPGTQAGDEEWAKRIAKALEMAEES